MTNEELWEEVAAWMISADVSELLIKREGVTLEISARVAPRLGSVEISIVAAGEEG